MVARWIPQARRHHLDPAQSAGRTRDEDRLHNHQSAEASSTGANAVRSRTLGSAPRNSPSNWPARA